MAGWQPHRSVEESLSVIRNILSEENTFAIIEKESGKIVGSTGLFTPQEKTIEKGKGSIEPLSKWLRRRYKWREKFFLAFTMIMM